MYISYNFWQPISNHLPLLAHKIVTSFSDTGLDLCREVNTNHRYQLSLSFILLRLNTQNFIKHES
ncbi:protein of unknown function [Vibrio tapetis subsp. tapetis]|uniref:Uncharacterized protein n=1 Tax=Vibrio tapetis subsp. tapetis TaxID=1671868 RepID=A0A2N8ZLP2_9VIBR|nr:protein of unknown function [Vibrio tapetis subsp. tapetis]